MKSLHLFQTILLLFVFDLCFAQRPVEAAQWQFGLMSNHFVVTEYTSGAEIRKIRPLRTSLGLQTGLNIGEHWGLGINADVRYLEAAYNVFIFPDMHQFYRDEWARLETAQYFGNTDLSGRYYLQGRKSAARVYFQLGFGTQIRYWESQRLRPEGQTEFDEAEINRFTYQNNSMLGGAGFQYRFAKVWQVEAAALLRWQGKEKFDYGLQLGLGRVFLSKGG